MYNYTFFHGSALVRLIQDLRTRGIELYRENHCYLVNKKAVIYLKHSTKRISPWHFTFSPDHLNEITTIKGENKALFLVLICNDDGICCCEVGSYFKGDTGFNYGSAVSAIRFIQSKKGKKTSLKS